MTIEFDKAKRAATLEARGLDLGPRRGRVRGRDADRRGRPAGLWRGALHDPRGSRRRDGGPGLDPARWRVPDHQHEESQ